MQWLFDPYSPQPCGEYFVFEWMAFNSMRDITSPLVPRTLVVFFEPDVA
jgi:hypothetical protein